MGLKDDFAGCLGSPSQTIVPTSRTGEWKICHRSPHHPAHSDVLTEFPKMRKMSKITCNLEVTPNFF